MHIELQENSNNDKLVSALLYQRAQVYQNQGRLDLARNDLQIAIKRDRTNEDAKQLIQQLLSQPTTAPASTPEPVKARDPDVEKFSSYLQRVSTGSTSHVKAFVQSAEFIDVLRACGSEDTDSQVKATAFVILTKILNPPPKADGYPMQTIIETCAQCFSRCIDSGKNADKILAYRTLHAIFQTSMTVGAAILSQEGVVEEMMDVIEFEILPVQIAMTDVMAIASSDKTCQKLIVKYGSQWLAKTATRSKDDRLKAAASNALTKLQAQQKYDATDDDKGSESLTNAMSQASHGDAQLTDGMIQTIKNFKIQQTPVLLNAVEALAYSSLQPDTKETVANDPVLLKSLVALSLQVADTNNTTLLFGIATILANVTMYRPLLTEEQKQMKKLRDLANAKGKKGQSTSAEDDDPRERDTAVDNRVRAVVEQGVALALITFAKNSSQNLKAAAAQTCLNVVTPQSTRGKLLQQGIAKALVPLAVEKQADFATVAAQAAARLAITTDPRLAFGSQTCLELARPLLGLCKNGTTLQQFEGLMALTNMASVDDSIRQKLVDEGGVSMFENLQLSNHDMVQRAATEMICNMTFNESVFTTYSKSSNRLRLLMILADHEDEATRRAASGALAILGNSPEACQRMAKVDKGYERITRTVSPDETAAVQHRGIEIIRCMLAHLGKEAAQNFVRENAHTMLVTIVKQSKDAVVQKAAVEVLKMFAELHVQIKA